jgi:phosphatidylinositol-3-phosphatase
MPPVSKIALGLSFMLSMASASAADNSFASPFGTLKGVAPVIEAVTPVQRNTTIPRYDHVVIVVLENEGASQVIGSSDAPYINSLVKQGAYFSNSHGVTHPSQPNYLALFSGSTQGVSNDACPHTFSANNLGNQLLAAGFSFTGYAESLPYSGYAGCTYNNLYARKHAPWVNFTNVPTASSQPFSTFPSDFRTLPTVSFVVPNLCDDNHDCPMSTGDSWLQNNLDAYVQWAQSNNSLLILTWDEDEGTTGNQISTIFVGARINSGSTYSQSINHYNVLRTLEDMYGLTNIGNAAKVSPVSVW